MIWHFIWCDQRSAWGGDWIGAASLRTLSSLGAGSKFHERGNLELKANTWKFNRTIIEILQLIRNHSLIHIQMLGFFKKKIQTELRAAEHLEETFVPWVTGRQLPPPKLLTVLWHSLLSQLRAMWHRASLIHRQWTSLLLTQWKGCKLHFIAANPVANGTLSRVLVVACVLLAGARFVVVAVLLLLLLPSLFFFLLRPVFGQQATLSCKVAYTLGIGQYNLTNVPRVWFLQWNMHQALFRKIEHW